MPPFLEYLDSLLLGTGPDLDLRTFKVTDQVSGRMLGVRADMTPQVARIDAHRLAREGAPIRLCYAGTVLHARADRVSGARSPVQVGAEIYGHAGVESDIEAIGLMLEMLRSAGFERPHIDVGHLGVFRGLARGAALDDAEQAPLFAALQRKAEAEIDDLLQGVPAPWRERFGHLAGLNGGPETLDEAAGRFAGDPPVPEEVEAALGDLRAISEGFRRLGETVHFDLAELRGYRYHGGGRIRCLRARARPGDRPRRALRRHDHGGWTASSGHRLQRGPEDPVPARGAPAGAPRGGARSLARRGGRSRPGGTRAAGGRRTGGAPPARAVRRRAGPRMRPGARSRRGSLGRGRGSDNGRRRAWVDRLSSSGPSGGTRARGRSSTC